MKTIVETKVNIKIRIMISDKNSEGQILNLAPVQQVVTGSLQSVVPLQMWLKVEQRVTYIMSLMKSAWRCTAHSQQRTKGETLHCEWQKVED